MKAKVQVHALLGVLSFLLVMGSSLLPVNSQVPQSPQQTQIAPLPPGFPASVPPLVAQCFPPLMANQVQFVSMATAPSGIQYLSVIVTPITPVTPATPNEDPSQAASDFYEDTVGPWQLVISYNQNQCQPMNTIEDPEARGVEEGARRSLTLDRVQRLAAEMGGLNNFLHRLFSFEGDENHGGEIPENLTVTSEMGWVLEQLGVQLPLGWSVAP